MEDIKKEQKMLERKSRKRPKESLFGLLGSILHAGVPSRYVIMCNRVLIMLEMTSLIT